MKKLYVAFIIILFMIIIGVDYSYAKQRVGNSFIYNNKVCDNYDELNMVQKIECLEEKIKVLEREVEETFRSNYKKCSTPTEQNRYRNIFRKERELIEIKLDFIKERYKNSGSYGSLITLSHLIEMYKKLIVNIDDLIVGPGDTAIENNDF